MKTGDNILILDNIRSAHNVGSIFRTADAVGVSKIYLVGITPAPLDRFGRERKDVAKAALGGEKTVAWSQVAMLRPLIRRLKKEGYRVIAIEQSKNAVDYATVRPSEKNAFVLGREVGGLPEKALAESDVVAQIPMRGKKESLNVAVACGVALFRILG